MSDVERGRIEDIEVGCSIWSLSHSDSHGYPRGGVVVDTHWSEDEFVESTRFTVVEFTGTEPKTWGVLAEEINPEATKFFTRDTKIVVDRIYRWLGTAKRTKVDPERRKYWSRTVAALDACSEGSLTPRANERYLAARKNPPAQVL